MVVKFNAQWKSKTKPNKSSGLRVIKQINYRTSNFAKISLSLYCIRTRRFVHTWLTLPSQVSFLWILLSGAECTLTHNTTHRVKCSMVNFRIGIIQSTSVSSNVTLYDVVMKSASISIYSQCIAIICWWNFYAALLIFVVTMWIIISKVAVATLTACVKHFFITFKISCNKKTASEETLIPQFIMNQMYSPEWTQKKR